MRDKPQRSFDARTDVASGPPLVVRGMDAFELDHVAATIWTLLDGERTVGEITAEVCRAYQVSPDRAGPDVQALLAELSRNGLIE
jgi:hypothetical protein